MRGVFPNKIALFT